jgi:hypothetical protein
MRWTDLPPRNDLGHARWLLSLLLLSLPTATLGLLASRTGLPAVALGAGVQALFLLVFLRAHPVWRPPVSVSVVILYLIALLWAWVPLRDSADWVVHLAQGALLLVAVGLFAVHDLARTGAESLRRANNWSRRIARRADWPVQLADCRLVPEVAGLRDAVRAEAGAALALLSDPRPEVQVAALGALEHRPHWRSGEAELVLKVGRESLEAAVRVATTYALAGVGRGELVAELARFLGDPAPEVRRAAAEALMWDADVRWPFAREVVKATMADPRLADDGPLFVGLGRLPAAAVADCITWSAEHPPLAHRAILTVIEHFHSDLSTGERPDLGNELAAMMLDNETPPALRVEIASLLREHHLLTPDLLDRLTNLDQPAPMRLFAAELMLRINPHDPDGMDVLRGLARQPNRELAVQVGAVLQYVLGMDMGLSSGELPQPNSKQAAEVARRVLAWANGGSVDLLRPTPGPRGAKPPGSRHTAPAGHGSRQTMPAIPSTPPPREPMDESMLAASRGPLDDSLLAPPAGHNPLDESLMPPEELPEAEEEDGHGPARHTDSSAVF